MNINQYAKNDFTVLQIVGRVDASNAQECQEDILSVINAGKNKIILNLEKLDYISSAGLRAFLIIAKTLKPQEGVLRLCCLKENIKEIFDISGFSTIFEIFPNEDEAEKTEG